MTCDFFYDIINVKEMRKLSTCIFAMMVAAPGCFASDVVVSRAIPTTADSTTSANSARTPSEARLHTSRVTANRSATTTSDIKAQDKDNVSVAVRNAASRVFTGDTDKKENTRNVQSRAGVITRSLANEKTNASARSGLDAAVNTVGRNSRVSSASINSNPAVRRAGLVLRPSTAEVGGRATIGDTGVQTGSNINDAVRKIQSRAAARDATPESISDATNRLEQTATLNKSCQEQYNECMDQFCAVIDANQKRCSCSANLSRYTKAEEAVKDANTQLNEVAQRIRYVGLSADEIRAIMTQTEAEAALSGAVDTSETRNMLEEIEDLIRDPSAGTSYASDTYSGLDLDLDFEFSSDTSDMFNLDFLTGGTDSSFSNLRGADLYNAAKKRCKTILNQCKDAGATTQQLTGNYDLAIDKDCIAYEQGLVKMNETLLSNVRSANRMLQKARLAVLQNKNQYDAKGCIAALDTCMRDEMVCGDNYFKCVDPTKRFIDENGNVVLGQDISKITAFMEEYNNANIVSEFLGDAYKISINQDICAGDQNDGSCVVKYLLQKIGTKQNVTDEGLCRAVLDKCQRYTYNSNGNYIPYNDIVVNYVQRAMVNIRAAQQNIISDYASKCMVDVAECYNQQVTQVNAWSSSANVSSIYNVMRGACRNVALTCAYAVFDNSNLDCGDTNSQDTCITGISEMFYQSLLCPDNSTYSASVSDSTGNGTEWANSNCKCDLGYEAWGGQCVLRCSTNQTRNASGICVCNDGYIMKNGVCTTSEQKTE